MNESALPLAPNQPDPAEMRQVEGQGGWLNSKLFADGTGVHAIRSGFNQEAEDRQPRFMAEGGEQFGCV